MPCELLIKAVDHGNYLKGYPIMVKDSPAVWGSDEGLPVFIRITITDKSAAELQKYLDPWPLKFQHEILSQDAESWRIKISVDPIYINASNTSADVMKTGMITFLQEEFIQATGITFASDSITFTLQKTIDRETVKSMFADVFDDIFDIRRYYIKPGTVNFIVNNGGTYETDFNTIKGYVQDKLEE